MIMKKSLAKSFAIFALTTAAISTQAATYNMGIFTPPNPDGNYSTDITGIFLDEFDFYARNNQNYYQGISMNISGTHTGMYNNELLLINLNTSQTYILDDIFDLTFNNLRSRQRFAITGSGLNATDSAITSTYNLSFQTVPYSTTPTNPVPVPAAIWLFASGLISFVSINRKRKSTVQSS
jgi:hypothetical protein